MLSLVVTVLEHKFRMQQMNSWLNAVTLCNVLQNYSCFSEGQGCSSGAQNKKM